MYILADFIDRKWNWNNQCNYDNDTAAMHSVFLYGTPPSLL